MFEITLFWTKCDCIFSEIEITLALTMMTFIDVTLRYCENIPNIFFPNGQFALISARCSEETWFKEGCIVKLTASGSTIP